MTGIPQSAGTELTTALQRNRGTVTEFLELLAGEPIDADIRFQKVGPAGGDNPLGLVPDAEVLRRAVLLTGRTTGRTFVYAESAIDAHRLPGPVRRQLETSRDPIGRVLLDHRLAVRREPLAGPVVAKGAGGDITTLLHSAPLSRRYRIILDSAPAMVVSEWFLQPVPDALATRSRTSASPNH
jgi:chorismate-pyruvate lyase